MSSRAVLAAALAVLMLSGLMPGGAQVLCIAADGCAALEPAAPGSTRCLASHCDDAHRGERGDACRDVPVLQHALPSAPAAPALLGPALPILPVAMAAPDGRAHLIPPQVTAPPARDYDPRRVVLQL